jgi:sulfate adenylyltransferase
MSFETIPAHGGKLISRIAEGKEREELQKSVAGLHPIQLSPREVSDVEMIANGGFSPLEGFMTEADYHQVMDTKRLTSGLVWTIPIVLAVSKQEAKDIKPGQMVSLTDPHGILGVMEVTDKYAHAKEKEAVEVYGTKDEAHPGVAVVMAMEEICLGGKITLLRRPVHEEFNDLRMEPAESRELFKKKGWRRVVGFQTRNPIHRAHEYIQKCALEITDGLFLHPLVGETKAGDVPASVIVACYKKTLEEYYPQDRVCLSVFPGAMRYAGPREAIFHAIVRKNYGCTHFIVGRDHAGAGKFYGSFDAHYIFDEFTREDLDILPLFFDYTFYCKKCDGMASFKTCAHDESYRVSLSGTKVREMLMAGQCPPPEFSRPEIAKILIDGMAKTTV